MNRISIVLIGIFLLAAILFYPGFLLYFHQDDFMHMAVSQRWEQVITAYNIFHPGEFPFYRPIPTQTYYFFLGLLFGNQPFGYHVVNFLMFCLNTWLVYRLGMLLLKKRVAALIAAGFYAINATHVAPLFAAAYVHELLYVCFALVMAITFVQRQQTGKRWYDLWSLGAFILALMSKENAVVLPGILVLLHLYLEKTFHFRKMFQRIIPYAIILAIYLYGHFFFYGLAVSSSYHFMVGKASLNILIWYMLWAFSTPNILIDFFGPGLCINPVFFQVTGWQGWLSIVVFPLLLLSLSWFGYRMLRSEKKTIHIVLLGITWFITGMIPLLVFPLHHLATEQAFSLIGFSFIVGALIAHLWKTQRLIGYVLIILYLLTAGNSIVLARRTHWIVRSSEQAKAVLTYLSSVNVSDTATVYFLDGEIKIPAYGSSKQLHEALGQGIGLNLMLKKPSLKSEYEYLNPRIREATRPGDVVIDSSRFLGY